MDELTSDYDKAGFNGALTFGKKPALLIVDVCRAYVEPDCPLYAGPSALDALQNNIRLRQAAHAKGLPVVFTAVEYLPDGVDGGLFFRKVPALRHFVKGNEMAEFMPDLTPEGSDILVTKQYPSAFFGTSLAPMLTSIGVDTVLITGYSTSGCVRASTLDALCHGFAPFVIRDACADRADGPHESNLFDMQAKYAEVLTTNETLDRLLSV